MKTPDMADPTTNLLPALWIEVGRHQRVAESVSVFVDAVREAMPLRRLQGDEFRAEPDEFTPLLVWPDQETPPRP